MSNFAERLKKIREKTNMTQQELSDKIGVKRQIVNYYENNIRQPKLTDVIQISKIFNVTTDYLLCTSDIENPYINIGDAAINKKLGLSEKSIEFLKTINNSSDKVWREIANTINFLLEEIHIYIDLNKKNAELPTLVNISNFFHTKFDEKYLNSLRDDFKIIHNGEIDDEIFDLTKRIDENGKLIVISLYLDIIKKNIENAKKGFSLKQ